MFTRIKNPISIYLIISLIATSLVACGVSPNQGFAKDPLFNSAIEHLKILAQERGIYNEIALESSEVEGQILQIAYVSGIGSDGSYQSLSTFLGDSGEYIYAIFKYNGSYDDINTGTALENSKSWSEQYIDHQGNVIYQQIEPQAISWVLIRAVLSALARAGIKYLTRQACVAFIEKNVPIVPSWLRKPICIAIGF